MVDEKEDYRGEEWRGRERECVCESVKEEEERERKAERYLLPREDTWLTRKMIIIMWGEPSLVASGVTI